MTGEPEFRRVFRLPRAPRRQVARELDDEFDYHLDRRIEKLVGEGLSPDEARTRALETFGDVDDVRAYCFKQSVVRERTMRGIDWLSDTWQDLKFSARSLRKRPVFVAAVTLTLALGIGAATAVFTVVNAVLLKPLPFEDSDRLVGVWLTSPGWDVEWLEQPPATYFAIREDSESFEDSGLWKNTFVTVTGLDEAKRVPATMVTDGVLPLLRARPMMGRLFTAEDDIPGSPQTVIVSHEFWQRRLGGDPDVIGRTIVVERSPREIIGVMPPGFRFMSNRSDVYWLRQFDPATVEMGDFSYNGVARLKPGVTLEQARADASRVFFLALERYEGMSPEYAGDLGMDVRLRPLKTELVGQTAPTLWILLGTVAIVLLIACANVANLLLVRAQGRSREVAMRAAIGASRARIAQGFLTEGLVLSLVGGIAGLGLAWFGVRTLLGTLPDQFPRLAEISTNGTALLFCLGLTVLTGLVFGLLPVWRASGSDLAAELKAGGRGGAGRETNRTRNALVVSQVALALVLLVGAGLMVRSFRALNAVHPGFGHPDEVITFRVSMPGPGYSAGEEGQQTVQAMVEALEQLPGAGSVAAITSFTMDGSTSNTSMDIEDYPTGEGETRPSFRVKWTAGDYFELMENPVLAGRPITRADVRDRNDVVVVTENLALSYWDSPGAALGKRIRDGDTWRTIVGVVGNVRDHGPGEPPVAVVYYPAVVNDFWGADTFVPRWMAYAVRTSGSAPASLMPEVRRIVRSVSPDLAITGIQTLEEIHDLSMVRTSFTLVLLGVAALVALFLGVIGIYGVVSYAVGQRTREIGVRMALGAATADVSRLVVGQGFRLAAAGVVIGALGAALLTRLMTPVIYGVSPADPATYAAVSVILMAVALLASYVPARRASAVNPVEALRAE